jgi:ATP/maltotriose-dependent transcriptional regulator MalT
MGDTAALLTMLRGMMVLYEHHAWWIDGAALFGHAADTLHAHGEPAHAARGQILGTQGYFLLRSGRPAAGAVHLEEGLALMEAAEALPHAAFLVFNLGTTELYGARIEPARDRYRQALRLAEAAGDDFVRLWTEYFLGIAALFSGDFTTAEQQFVVCRDAWNAQGFTRGLASANIFLGETLRLAGRLAAAEVAIREGLAVCSTHGDVLMLALAQRELSALALGRGADDEAYALAAESAERLRELDDMFAYGRSRALLVQLQVRRGMLGAARDGCAELLRAARNGALTPLPDAAYGIALLYHVSGADVESLAILQALEGTPGEYATLQRATQLRTALEQKLTPTQRSRAVEQARVKDLLPWLEELCARSPAPPAEAPPPDDPPIVPVGGLYVTATGETLSPREVEVLRLLIAGASNPQIAVTLVISPFTVKHHVAHILEKLDVATRTEAALRGRDLGLTPLAPQ